MGRFPSRKSPGKQPIKKRGMKRFSTDPGFSPSFCSFEGSRASSKPAPNPGTHQLRLKRLRVVRRNGCPKGWFWTVRFFPAPLRFALKTSEILKWAERKRTLQEHPFGQPFLRMTPSPWRAPILAQTVFRCTAGVE